MSDITAVGAVPKTGTTPLTGEVLRVFAGLAGLGAALCYFGISSGTALSSSPIDGFGGVWQVAGAAVAGLWGLALTLWSVTSLTRQRPIHRTFSMNAVPIVAFLTAIVLASVLWGAGTEVPAETLVAAIVLQVLLIATVIWGDRRAQAATQSAARPVATLMLMAAGAVIVSAIATPGLAATTAGDYAVPHPHTLPGAEHVDGH